METIKLTQRETRAYRLALSQLRALDVWERPYSRLNPQNVALWFVTPIGINERLMRKNSGVIADTPFWVGR